MEDATREPARELGGGHAIVREFELNDRPHVTQSIEILFAPIDRDAASSIGRHFDHVGEQKLARNALDKLFAEVATVKILVVDGVYKIGDRRTGGPTPTVPFVIAGGRHRFPGTAVRGRRLIHCQYLRYPSRASPLENSGVV